MTSPVQGLPLAPAASAPSATPHASSKGFKSTDYHGLYFFTRLQGLTRRYTSQDSTYDRLCPSLICHSSSLQPVGEFKSTVCLYTVTYPPVTPLQGLPPRHTSQDSTNNRSYLSLFRHFSSFIQLWDFQSTICS